MARAPQSFFLDDIIGAHRRSQKEGITSFIDSCSLMSHYGYKLGLVQGPMENIKITTPTDYFVLRAMVEVHENQQIFKKNDYRIILAVAIMLHCHISQKRGICIV